MKSKIRVCVISQWFSPGHTDHIVALCRMFVHLGYEATAFLNSEYRDYVTDDMQIFYSDEQELPLADLYLIWNISPKDWRSIRASRKTGSSSKWVFTYHEPYLGVIGTIKSYGFNEKNWPYTFKALVRQLFTRPVLGASDLILFASEKASEQCRLSNPEFAGKGVVLPLPFPDYFLDEDTAGPREYFSFVATASPDKAFKNFLNFVIYASEHDDSIKFQVVTRTDISEMLTPDLRELEGNGRLRIEHGRDLSTNEINAAFKRSNCCWFAYNRSNQSGALCKALMFGVPVLYTNVGSFPDYLDATCGVCVESNIDNAEIYKGYQRILENADSYRKAARERYLTQFDAMHLSGLYEESIVKRLFGQRFY